MNSSRDIFNQRILINLSMIQKEMKKIRIEDMIKTEINITKIIIEKEREKERKIRVKIKIEKEIGVLKRKRKRRMKKKKKKSILENIKQN